MQYWHKLDTSLASCTFFVLLEVEIYLWSCDSINIPSTKSCSPDPQVCITMAPSTTLIFALCFSDFSWLLWRLTFGSLGLSTPLFNGSFFAKKFQMIAFSWSELAKGVRSFMCKTGMWEIHVPLSTTYLCFLCVVCVPLFSYFILCVDIPCFIIFCWVGDWSIDCFNVIVIIPLGLLPSVSDQMLSWCTGLES